MPRGIIAGLVLTLWASAAGAFVSNGGAASVDALARALRWSAAPHAATGGRGLHDGLQVAVAPGFAEMLVQRITGTLAPEDVADVRAATVRALRAWESPALTFVVTFDGPTARGVEVGQEIDLFVVGSSDPAVAPARSAFGFTQLRSVFVADRRLTNGQVLAGDAILGADVFINVDMIAAGLAQAPVIFGRTFSREEQLAALTRLIAHEVGHALGLDHPNDFAVRNFDTDTNPLDAMRIDPTDPLARLRLSEAVDVDAVMSDGATTLPDALLFTALRNDDRGGRDVLYPAAGPRPCGTGVHPPALECDDGDLCNGVEVCEPTFVCADGAPLVCDDGDPCNGIESCDASGCVSGLGCEDQDVCTIDSCAQDTGCVHEDDRTVCPRRGVGVRAFRLARRPTPRLLLATEGPIDPPTPSADPSHFGATLLVRDAGGRSVVLTLPSSRWRALDHGFRYRDAKGRHGPCRLVILRPDAIKVVCEGARIGVAPPLAPPVDVVLTAGVSLTGTTTWCGRLSSAARNGPRVFAATDVAPPADCPPQ